MKHYMRRLLICTAFLLSTLFILSAAPVMADTPAADPPNQATPTPTPVIEKTGKWVKNKKGFYSYYDENGKKAVGLTTVKKRTYYFDSKGIQVNGWQQIKNSYYFFRIANGSGAYMVTNTTVNGIKLGKNGKAVLKTTASKDKVKLLYNSQLTARKIITNNTMTKSQKLRALYDWTQKNTNIRKTNIGGFKRSKPDWDVYYGGLVLNAKTLPARGDCYTYASTFGYLANAIGYKATICSSGGHGFVMIDQKFYDPSWQKAISRTSFFGLGWDSIATGLGLRYRNNMRYTRVV